MLHHFVTLVADVMFDNDIPFLMTLSGSIRLITAEFLPSHTAAHRSISLSKAVKSYSQGGFVVYLVLMNMEFENVNDKFNKGRNQHDSRLQACLQN